MPRNMDSEITRRLLAWYAAEKRDLPWRKTSDPYRIWVSEIMLQQTQVDTVIPYYGRFLKRFPTVERLACAGLEQVLKLWENLGYYSRARNLHAAAKLVVEKHGGRLPADRHTLRSLPGIGDYTAGAILSIAYGLPEAAVDGNVLRVVSRLFAIQACIEESAAKIEVRKRLTRLIPEREPGHFNQGLMDLGAMICTPRNPDCRVCPLTPSCGARKQGLTELIPFKKKSAPVPHRESAAGLIRNCEGRILIVRRPDGGLLGGLWQFPATAPGAKASSARLQEFLENSFGISVRLGKEIAAVEHGFSHFSLTVHVYPGTFKGLSVPAKSLSIQWAAPAAIQKLPLSKLDRMILQAVLSGAERADKAGKPRGINGKVSQDKKRRES